MLAVTQLDISHFRSWKAARIAPGPGPVALHGPNGAGKTNILEALSLFSPGRGLRRAAPEDLARQPEAIGWKLTAHVEGPSGRHEIATWAEAGSGRQVEIDGKPAPQLALARLLRLVWLVPAMDRLWTDTPGERRRFIDRVAMSLEPGHAEAALAYERAMRERNRLLKEGATDAAWYDALEAQMAVAGATLSANRGAAVARLNAAQQAHGDDTAFPRAELAMVSGDDYPPEHSTDSLAGALREGRRRDLAAGRSLTGPHRADLLAVYAAKQTEARLCSTGEQKALLIAVILANARAIAADFGAPPVLLLDEVAAHLDAGRRAALYAEIAGLGAQAWMTGTGAELFAALDASARRYAVREDGGASALAQAEGA